MQYQYILSLVSMYYLNLPFQIFILMFVNLYIQDYVLIVGVSSVYTQYFVFCTFRNILGFETVCICWKSYNNWVTDIYSELVMFTLRSGISNKDVSIGWYSELLCIILFFVIVWLNHRFLVSFTSTTLNKKSLWFAYQEKLIKYTDIFCYLIISIFNFSQIICSKQHNVDTI